MYFRKQFFHFDRLDLVFRCVDLGFSLVYDWYVFVCAVMYNHLWLSVMVQAYAGFYYTAWALRLVGSPPLDKFNSTLWSFCNMDWTQVCVLLTVFNLCDSYKESARHAHICWSAKRIMPGAVRVQITNILYGCSHCANVKTSKAGVNYSTNSPSWHHEGKRAEIKLVYSVLLSSRLASLYGITTFHSICWLVLKSLSSRRTTT